MYRIPMLVLLTLILQTPVEPFKLSADGGTLNIFPSSKIQSICFLKDCFTVDEIKGTKTSAPGLISNQQVTIKTLNDNLIKMTSDWSSCQEQLGPLARLKLAMMTGEVILFSQAKAQFEKANPGKSIDPSWKVIDKASEGK